MKLFKALANCFRSADEKAAAALSDNLRDAKFEIADNKTAVDKLTQDIATLMGNTKSLNRELEERKLKVSQLQTMAEKAAAKGVEADVAEAVRLKKNAQAEVARLEGEVGKNKTVETRLRQQLAAARTKIANDESRVQRAAAARTGNAIRERAAQSGLLYAEQNGNSGALERLEQESNSAGDRAEALEQLGAEEPVNREAALEERYGAGSGAEVDDEVAALMRKAKEGQGQPASV